MNAEDFRILYDYNAWANHRTLDACAALNSEQFTRDLGSSFRSVRDTLAHVFMCEHLWLERWHGRSLTDFPPVSDYPDLASVQARWAEIERDLLDYIASLKTEDVQRVMHYQTTTGAAQAQPLWQMLQHMVNHSSYHRGQLATLLRQLGAKPAATDLIVFYRERAAKSAA